MDPDLSALTTGFPPGAGPVGLLSSDEFTPEVAAFDRAFLELTGPAVGLVICADHRAAPHSIALARDHFTSLGARVVADDLVHAGEIGGLDLIYLAGGSPAALLDHLRDAPAWGYLESLWQAGVGLAGASAGAMALCSHSLTPRPGDNVPTVWSAGLAVVRGVGLAVHASTRPNAWIRTVAARAPSPVLAMDDKTGVIITGNADPKVIGPGSVWFVGEQQ